PGTAWSRPRGRSSRPDPTGALAAWWTLLRVDAFSICGTCGVEHAEAVGVCEICADDRQWVPADGQHWTTIDELAASGRRTQLRELEPGLLGLTVAPKVGIGQQAHVVRTPAGS